MKKTLALSLILAASMGLAACNKAPEAANTAALENVATDAVEGAANVSVDAMNAAGNVTEAASNVAGAAANVADSAANVAGSAVNGAAEAAANKM
jgi:hypothetical protein